MKSILISIQPKWCELIASGKKTVEVRKTRPKIETPFKCYIYETKSIDKSRLVVYVDGNEPCQYYKGKGKVVGEFVCDCIEEIGFSPYNHGEYICKDQSFVKQSCVPFNEIFDYIADGYGYGWHISDLVIYDKPRELSEFKKPCNKKCDKCDYIDVQEIGAYEHTKEIKTCLNFINRPPQSWCYVEGVQV
jgi:predicted transcriptional regulator